MLELGQGLGLGLGAGPRTRAQARTSYRARDSAWDNNLDFSVFAACDFL